ncbi:hypothetical protein FRC02_004086 [Tulasnella sp. 418]|nr:hypothetical protein FRC02_004086 [Tulasnella sp. 418]
MVMMIKTNPELAKPSLSEGGRYPSSSSNRPESMYQDPSANRQSMAFGNGDGYDHSLSNIQSDEEIEIGHNFTYIPPNPKKYYKRLLEICVQFDLEAMVNLPEDQEVSLGILSPKHLEVINECALRWRLTHTYRVTCFLDVIKYKYEREEVPIECLPEALQMIQKAVEEVTLEDWPRYDADYLSTVFGGLFNIFLGELYEGLEDITKLKPDAINPSIDILQIIRESGLVERYKADIEARLKDLSDRVRVQAVHHYTDKNYELMTAEGDNKALPLLLLTDHLEKQAKLLDKRFPQPLLGELDLVCLALESQIPMFLTDLDSSRRALLEGSITKPPKVPIEDVFALYRRTKTLLQMHKAFCPKSPVDFDLVGFFEPYSPLDFMMELKWPDAYQEARFFTALSKTINKSIEQYCRSIEDLFMEEMFPRPPPEVQQQKQSAWIEKAKLTIQGEKKVEPFNFTPKSMVKLNNIEAARNLLDKMYDRIDADRISAVLEEHGPPVPDKVDRQTFLFTVKICLAENLVPLESSPSAKLDTFVTLSDEKGNRLAKTRTIYESLDPQWDQTFDMSVESTTWLMASVRDKALIGKHDTVGRAYLCLDPRIFGDFMSHDLWYDLDTAGRLLIRVSMEGEKDDIQFYFGRAFRSLKRAETDMTRVIIDKMAPMIRQHLSRSVLKTLVKSTSAAISYDYNKAIGGVTAFYRSAMGTDKADTMIPLPQKEKARIKPEVLTDVEIEQAIVPLFDYFDANFQILHNHLSPTTKEGSGNKF